MEETLFIAEQPILDDDNSVIGMGSVATTYYKSPEPTIFDKESLIKGDLPCMINVMAWDNSLTVVGFDLFGSLLPNLQRHTPNFFWSYNTFGVCRVIYVDLLELSRRLQPDRLGCYHHPPHSMAGWHSFLEKKRNPLITVAKSVIITMHLYAYLMDERDLQLDYLKRLE